MKATWAVRLKSRIQFLALTVNLGGLSVFYSFANLSYIYTMPKELTEE